MSRPATSILVVEDHDESRDALAKVLRLHGYAVTTAPNARDARRLAEQTNFDLVLCDLGLPDQAGHELFADLRRARPSLRGIAVTGMSISDTMHHIQDSGFDRYLLKPLTIDSLVSTIESVLSPMSQRTHRISQNGRSSDGVSQSEQQIFQNPD